MNKNCLSYWFPRIKGLAPVPQTTIIRTDCELIHLCDGKTPNGWDSFLSELTSSCERMGFPVFLRTGMGSGKHQWRDTCYVKAADALQRHVAMLVEWSECVDMMGLPYDVWVVREMLPTEPAFRAEMYGGMPVNREFRLFVRDGGLQCHHPYWPDEAFESKSDDWLDLKPTDEAAARYLEAKKKRAPPENWRALLSELRVIDVADFAELEAMTEAVGEELGGYWSVDWLWTRDGWYLTDMAEGDRSWHWPGCEHCKD